MFHIRIRCEPVSPSLIDESVGNAILQSVRMYAEQQNWSCFLFLLLPDHLHALLSFPRDKGMGRIVGNWKRFHNKNTGIDWQDNYFDHRLRSEKEFEEKYAYIEQNPVALGLCDRADDWTWRLTCLLEGVTPRF